MQTTIDCAVITARYQAVERTDGETTILELWCRCKDGRSAVILINGINPWIEIASPGICENPEELPSDILAKLQRVLDDSDVISVEEEGIKWTDMGEKKHWRVGVRQPFVVRSLRDRLQKEGWVLSASDIVYQHRFFHIRDLGTHVSIKGDILFEKEGIDGKECVIEDEFSALTKIKTAGGSGIYPVDVIISANYDDCNRCEPFQAPWTVFSFDLETSILHDTVLCAAATIENWSTGERITYSFNGKEEDILIELTNLVREKDPDIITGYNIDNFDLTRLAERCEVLSGKRRWRRQAELFGWGRVDILENESKRRRDGLLPKRGNTRAWSIAGRCVMDAWWQARMTLRPKRETLKFVSNLLFPDDIELQKMDIDSSKMDEEWATRPEEVLKYCERDAELPLSILRSIQAVRRKEAIAAVAKTSLDVAANGVTSQLLDSLAIRYADANDIAVPMTHNVRRTSHIEGGYVHDVEAGIHPWITVLDFKSMYPSIMIGNNICFTTRIDSIHPDQPLKDETIHTSPTGVTFHNSQHRKGMVPALLEHLMGLRDTHKAAMKEAQKQGDEALVAFHDQMQYAVKIMMNSFYGVFASVFYRFTHKDLGASITAWARHNIKTIIQKLEEEGNHVVYSDTDSIFVCAPISKEISPTKPEKGEELKTWNSAKKELIRFGNELAERFSQDEAVLEFEKGLSVFFSHGAKKRYVGRIIYPEEDMIVRGYETQRSDSFDALTNNMQNMFEMILEGRSEDAVKSVVDLIKAAKRNEIPIEQLILSKTCKGVLLKNGEVDFSKHYANPDSMASVRAAKKRMERNLPFTPGMKVGYIVTNGKVSPMEVEPWDEGQENGGIVKYDGDFYAERLATALGRITEAFEWSSKELLAGNRQANLFSF